MLLGKKGPKIGSWSTRRFRLGTSHGGTPSAWIAPAKENPPERPKHPSKKNRR